SVGVILLHESPDPQLRLRAIDAGVHELVAAGDGSALTDAHRRIRAATTTAIERVPSRGGRVITVFSAKGGSGRTTLATNLAVVLNASGTSRVCLVDLDLGSGDVGHTLRLEPRRTLTNAVALAGKFDPTRAETFTTPYV